MIYDFYSIFNIVPFIIAFVVLAGIVFRWKVFRKMGARPILSLIPGLRAYVIFKRCWRRLPFFILLGIAFAFLVFAVVVTLANFGVYIPVFIKSRLPFLSFLCLCLMYALMNRRLAFAFGHDIGFALGLIFLNPVFMGILAFSKKSRYNRDIAALSGHSMDVYLNHTRNTATKILNLAVLFAICVCSVWYAAEVITHEHMPRSFIASTLEEFHDKTSRGDITGTGPVVRPADEVDAGSLVKSGAIKVREQFYPDKSDARNVTVYVYMIGSNMEDTSGYASINLRQMLDATKSNDNLRFVVEAGGTERWFTEGIRDLRTGRYVIEGGRLTSVMDMGSRLCMSIPGSLRDYLRWANENYPSDRRMLFLWNHGGGLGGFGNDYLNERTDKTLMSIPEIAEALEAAGGTYELIGFDACLMQTLEVGRALEPYTDYILGSEETEVGTGMYYTAAFSALAKKPTMSTEEFGAMMCSSFDQYQVAVDGMPQPGQTMSLTDTRYMPGVYDMVSSWMDEECKRFDTDKQAFLDFSTARSKAYEFNSTDQIDLIDFLYKANMTDDRRNDLITAAKSAVPVRSAASAGQINGLAFYMPYKNLPKYTYLYDDMEKLKLDREKNVYGIFATIIGSQGMSDSDESDQDYSSEKWFVKKYSDYNASLYIQNLDLKKTDDKYVVELPDSVKDYITDGSLGLRMKA